MFLKKLKILENVENRFVFKQIMHRRGYLGGEVLSHIVVLFHVVMTSAMLSDFRLYWPSAR